MLPDADWPPQVLLDEPVRLTCAVLELVFQLRLGEHGEVHVVWFELMVPVMFTQFELMLRCPALQRMIA